MQIKAFSNSINGSFIFPLCIQRQNNVAKLKKVLKIESSLYKPMGY